LPAAGVGVRGKKMDSVELKESAERNLDMPKELSPDTLLAYTRNKYYVNIWSENIQEGRSKLRFNFWAAIFGSTWCMYIKLYKIGLALSLLELATLCVGSYFFEHSWPESAKVIYFAIFVLIIVRIIFGFIANNLYLKKATCEILVLAKSKLPQMYFGAAVKSSGGVSFGIALAFGFAFSIIQRLAIDFIKNL